MSIKMSFGMIVFNGGYMLEENLKSIYPFAHDITITEGPVSHYRKKGFTTSTDNTVQIIRSFPDPQNKISLIQGQWDEKNDMCNAYMKRAKGDYIWHMDCDEFYKKEDMENVIKYLADNKDNCYSMAFRLRSFYGGFERYISGFEENFEVHRIKKMIPGQSRYTTHRPPTMLWPPSGRPCVNMGHHVNHYESHQKWGLWIYHYSHVFPKQVKAKMEYYKSLDSDGTGIISDYWNRLFVPWMRANTEEDKLKAEAPFKGVQEWVPQRRGDAYTAKFTGEHPDIIKQAMQKFRQKISDECKELGI